MSLTILQEVTKKKFFLTTLIILFVLPGLSSCALNKFKRKSEPRDPYAKYRTIPTTKGWESKASNSPRYMAPGDVFISLHPERRHGPKGFIANGLDKINQVHGIFSGVCEPIMTIDIKFKNPDKFNLAAYQKSGDSKDLPIQNILVAMRDVLEVQCQELSGFKVNAVVLYRTAPQFKGHMLASSNWQLIKGLPKGGFGEDYRIKLQIKSGFLGEDGILIDHTAKCEKQPSLLIKRYFLNNTQRAFPQKLSIYDFQRLAEAATKRYITECSNVEIIRFKIQNGILPAGYTCKKPNECIITRKSENWAVNRSAIARREIQGPREKNCLTKTFCNYKGGDVLNAIYEGNFNHFHKLDLEYTKGYDDFLKSLQTGNPILDNMYKRKSIAHSIINEYMFEYKNTSKSCLRDRYKTLAFKRHSSDIVLQNIYGVEAHRIKGINIESSYTVNKEFIPICKNVGSAVGGSSLIHETGDAWFNKGMRTRVLNGLKDMMQNEPCDSRKIQQFEKNLRNFYNRIY